MRSSIRIIECLADRRYGQNLGELPRPLGRRSFAAANVMPRRPRIILGHARRWRKRTFDAKARPLVITADDDNTARVKPSYGVAPPPFCPPPCDVARARGGASPEGVGRVVYAKITCTLRTRPALRPLSTAWSFEAAHARARHGTTTLEMTSSSWSPAETYAIAPPDDFEFVVESARRSRALRRLRVLLALLRARGGPNRAPPRFFQLTETGGLRVHRGTPGGSHRRRAASAGRAGAPAVRGALHGVVVVLSPVRCRPQCTRVGFRSAGRLHPPTVRAPKQSERGPRRPRRAVPRATPRPHRHGLTVGTLKGARGNRTGGSSSPRPRTAAVRQRESADPPDPTTFLGLPCRGAGTTRNVARRGRARGARGPRSCARRAQHGGPFAAAHGGRPGSGLALSRLPASTSTRGSRPFVDCSSASCGTCGSFCSSTCSTVLMLGGRFAVLLVYAAPRASDCAKARRLRARWLFAVRDVDSDHSSLVLSAATSTRARDPSQIQPSRGARR